MVMPTACTANNCAIFAPRAAAFHLAGPNLPETDQMVWDPAAGWTATLDLESRRGIAWLLDPAQVMMFYNCITAVTGRHIEEFPNRYGVDPLYMFDNASITAIRGRLVLSSRVHPCRRHLGDDSDPAALHGLTSVAHACDDFVMSVSGRRRDNAPPWSRHSSAPCYRSRMYK